MVELSPPASRYWLLAALVVGSVLTIAELWVYASNQTQERFLLVRDHPLHAAPQAPGAAARAVRHLSPACLLLVMPPVRELVSAGDGDGDGDRDWGLWRAATESWVPGAEEVCTVVFVGAAANASGDGGSEFRSRMWWVGEQQEVGAALTATALWKSVAGRMVDLPSYRWFFLIGAETVVGANNLEALLGRLDALGDTLQLRGELPADDVAGGECGVAARVVGRELLWRVSDCLQAAPAEQEGALVECARQVSDVRCDGMPGRSPGAVSLRYGFRRRLQECVSEEPDGVAVEPRLAGGARHAAFVHPARTRAAVFALHRELSSRLAPLLPPAAGSRALLGRSSSSSCAGQYARHFWSNDLCVHNPAYYLQLHSRGLVECPQPRREEPPDVGDVPVFVLTLEGVASAEANFRRVEGLLAAHGIRGVRKWPAVSGQKAGLRTGRLTTFGGTPMTAGELGYRASLVALLRHAHAQGLPRLMFFEDDVLLDCQFAERLRTVLHDHRCAGHMFSAREGGVLLLGASMFAGFGHWGAEVDDHRRAFGVEPLCVNFVDGVLGSFAFMVHRAAFLRLAELAERSPNPFDWMWPELAEDGFIVRLVHPPLVIADISHKSTVDASRGTSDPEIQRRIELHRWNLRTYCRVDTES